MSNSSLSNINHGFRPSRSRDILRRKPLRGQDVNAGNSKLTNTAIGLKSGEA
jgi:hypothetical protein